MGSYEDKEKLVWKVHEWYIVLVYLHPDKLQPSMRTGQKAEAFS